jgi:hypothetical protein
MTALPPMNAAPSFLCAPIGDLDRLAPGIVALAGLFLDHGDATAFGRRFAARQLRYACALERISSRASCVDLGDVNVFPLEPARQEAALRRQIAAIAATGAVAVLVGGRRLGFPLGACIGAATVEVDDHARLHGDTPLAAIIDLAPVFGPAPAPGVWRAMQASISALPRRRVVAAHLTGFAPDLDVAGRREASLAARTLQLLADHLGARAP